MMRVMGFDTFVSGINEVMTAVIFVSFSFTGTNITFEASLWSFLGNLIYFCLAG